MLCKTSVGYISVTLTSLIGLICFLQQVLKWVRKEYRVSHILLNWRRNNAISRAWYISDEHALSQFFHKLKIPCTYTSTACNPAQEIICKICSNHSLTNTWHMKICRCVGINSNVHVGILLVSVCYVRVVWNRWRVV